MKKLCFNPPYIYGFLIGLLATLIIACGNPVKMDDSKEKAKELNDAKFNDKKQELDAKFLVSFAELNLKEISLGELAAVRGNTKETQDLGKQMSKEHNKAFNDLKTLAANKMISIPTTLTEDGQNAYLKLSGESGNDFDKDFTDMMVDNHKEAIYLFEKASKDAEDPDIRQFANNMIPELRSHLDQSVVCQDKIKTM